MFSRAKGSRGKMARGLKGCTLLPFCYLAYKGWRLASPSLRKTHNRENQGNFTTSPLSADCIAASKTAITFRTSSGFTANSAPLLSTSEMF